jgi:hypothetical protein
MPAGPTGSVSDPTPAFSWSTISGVTTYQVKLVDLTTKQTSLYTTTDPTWTPPADLIVSHRYRFAVAALNSLNEGSLSVSLVLRIV